MFVPAVKPSTYDLSSGQPLSAAVLSSTLWMNVVWSGLKPRCWITCRLPVIFAADLGVGVTTTSFVITCGVGAAAGGVVAAGFGAAGGAVGADGGGAGGAQACKIGPSP